MFQKRFRRTDSAESNNSSLASFFLSRNNSKTRQQQGPSPVAPPGVGANGGHSVIERSASGGVCTVRDGEFAMPKANGRNSLVPLSNVKDTNLSLFCISVICILL